MATNDGYSSDYYVEMIRHAKTTKEKQYFSQKKEQRSLLVFAKDKKEKLDVNIINCEHPKKEPRPEKGYNPVQDN